LEQSKPFLTTLTKFLADPRADANLRAQCALTIAKLQPSPDTELWNALNSARHQNDDTLKSAATWAYCELGRYEELGLVMVPAGEFLMGSSEEDQHVYTNEEPQHTVYLPTYYIGKYPVTVDEYRTVLQENKIETSRNMSLKGMATHPVVNVTWDSSTGFVRWRGMTLPSEAEWEKAARGTDGRLYPWGNEWQNGIANTAEYWSKSELLVTLDLVRESWSPTPVGQFSPQGDSPYGCADMAGNVWEWTNSHWRKDARSPGFVYVLMDDREDMKADNSVLRVLRGGSFYDIHESARCAFRTRYNPIHFSRLIGFRVCVSPITSL
jgi:formylglycine-generating enzyme required for sulfatase activity